MNNATACFYLSGLHISGVQRRGEDYPSQTHSGASGGGSGSGSTFRPFGGGSAKESSSSAKESSDYILQKDMKKAFEFAYKACELRNMYACANLSQMYARGDGTEKNEAEAEKYKKLAMEMQEEAKKHQQTLEFQQGLKNTQ